MRRRERATEEELNAKRTGEREKAVEAWAPKTDLGKKVKSGAITSVEQVFDSGQKIMESEIVDALIENQHEKMVDFKKTTKVRRAGRMFSFRASVIIGDGMQFIGIGTAKDKEKFPAIRKATKQAKLNMFKVRKGCGSWECNCGASHSVPFKLEGKSASVRVELKPAPKGTGLVAGDNIKDVLKFAGIQDVWCQTRGSTGTKLNFVRATIDALSKSTGMRLSKEMGEKFSKK